VRGCRKPIADPVLRRMAQETEATCAVDLEVEGWYWRALEDATLLAAGHLTLDDLSLADYIVAQEVASERDRIEAARAKAGRR
jgi:hypothetical protein